MYDKVSPPLPPTGAMIRLRKSVLFLKISRTVPNRPASSFTTFSSASRVVPEVHTDDFLFSKQSSLNFPYLLSLSARLLLRVISELHLVSSFILAWSRISLNGDSCCH